MKNWIVRWIANSFALLIVTQVIPDIHFKPHNPGESLSLIIAVIALGLANAVIRPIIMFFAWPINCLTFGLFGFVINVLLFWIVGSGVIPAYRVDGLVPAVIGSIAMGVISGLLSFFLKDRGDRDNK